MKQNFKRRLLAGLLSVCMMFQTVGTVPVYAAGNAADSGLPIGTSSVCTHHVHDEKCGYTEGTPCTHEHKVNGTVGDREDPLGDKVNGTAGDREDPLGDTEECSAEVTNCVHEHTDECYPVQDSDEATDSDAKEPTECTHICDEESGCITKELACNHVHDDKCGYTEGTPCTFDTATCESCKAKNTVDNRATLAVGEVYAVYEGSSKKFYAATADAPTTATTTVISDANKNTINHLYVMGASVPEKLIGDSNSDDNTNLKTVTCADSVTSIDQYAFSACTGLASVAMPNVTSIGENAFAYCKILASVDVSKVTTIGNRAFLGCAKLTSVAMPSATTIGVEAFMSCARLKSVAMPKVTTIGDSAFNDCTALASLTLGATAPTVGTDAFYKCSKTDALIIQGNTAFQDAATALAAYKMAADDNTTDDKWWGWILPAAMVVTPSAGTLEITTGKATSNLGQDNAITLTATFDKAMNAGKQRALTINRVEFKDGGNTLGTVTDAKNVDGKWVATLNVNTKDWAAGEHKLTAEYAGNNELGGSTTNEVTVTVNEVYAVYDGSSKKFYAATQTDQTTPTTTEITDKKTITNLYIKGESVPDKLMGEYDNLCPNLKTVTCANTVTTIGNRAFFSCKGLTNISLPSATTIGSEAFYGCNGLTSVELPSATTIGSEAFSDCKGLESVVLQRATSIGRLTFSGCTVLTSLTLGATPPTTVGTNAFLNCPTSRTLIIQGNPVFQDTVFAAYKAAADGNTADKLWYGWKLPTALDSTGVSNSAGTLAVTTGKATSNFGQDNAITLTATFDKAANMGKQKALTINQVEFKDGTNTLGAIATATQNADGKWVATLDVNTKDWAVGTHNLTAEYAGNHELGGITSNTVTFTQGEELNASNGLTFNSTSAEGIYKAGTGTITLAKAAGKYQFTFTNAVVAGTELNAITLPTDAAVEVKLVGTSTISSTNADPYVSGIYIGKGSNVTLFGEGTLTSAINYTVSVNAANLTMEGGTVINTKESGTTIFAAGANVKTAINGGTVQSTAKGSHAIQYGYDSAGGTLTISQPQGKTTLITTANRSSQNDSNIPTIYIGTDTTAVNISGGTIENTTGNMAIISSSTVTVTGTPSIKGLVRDSRSGIDGTYQYLSFYGTAYTLKGSLKTNDVIFMVNAGQTLIIPSGSVLTITERYNPSYIQNNGTIQNDGGIAAEVKGNAVQGGGTVAKKAKMTVSLTDSNGKPLVNPTYGDTVTVTATPEKDTEVLRAMQRAGITPTFKLMLYKDSDIFKQLGEMTYTKDINGVYTAQLKVKLDSSIKHDYHDSTLTAGANYQFICEFSGDEQLLKTSGRSENFSIAKKELTISGLTPQNRVYDEYNPSVTLTGTAALDGIEAADTGKVTLQDTNIIQGELENNYVGMGKKVTVVPQYLNGSAGQNYSLNTTLIETVDISRADNSITNRSTTSKYYGENFLIEYEIANKDTTQPTFTCEYKERSAADNTYTTTLPTNAGEYTMRVSATATQNYNACSATQDFEIKKAPLNVTAGTAEPKKWDGTKTATVTGLTFQNALTPTPLVGDEALVIGTDFIVTKAEYATANVNMNIIYATVALQNTTKANNYFLPSENGGVFPFEGSPIALADGPAAPTFSTMNDAMGNDTFTFNSTSATVYEYSKDSGTTWTDITASSATTAINVGNVALVAGALQVRIKATATHNASGVLANTAEQVFTASIDGSVSLNKTTGVTYGDTITATVSGQQSDAVLKYQWKADNVEISDATASTLEVLGSAVGKTITVEVSATGYNGNLTSTTNAVAKKAVTATAGTVSKVYDGTAAVETADRTLTITKVNASDDITITAANAVYNDASVNTDKAITLGTLSISGTAAGWYDVTAPTTVTGEIIAKEMTGATVTVGGTYTYTGSAITPTAENVTVKDGTTTLTNGTDYDYAASNNINAGAATLTVTLKGNYSGTASKTFIIAKVDPTYSIPTSLTAKYGQTLSAVNIGATTGFSWMDGTKSVGAVGAQTHKAQFTPTDTNNYNTVENIDVTVTVGKADAFALNSSAIMVKKQANYTVKLDMAAVSGDPAILGGTPTFAIAGSTSNGLTSATMDSDGKTLVLVANNTTNSTADTVTVSVTGMGNYENSTITVAVSYTDKTPVTITGVTVQDGTYHGGTQKGYIGTPTSAFTGSYDVTYTGRNGMTYNSTNAPKNVGDYTVTISVPDSDATYFGSISLNFTINKATVTIKADNKSAYVGDTQPTLTYTATGLATGESLQTVPTLTCTPDMSKAGSYEIIASGAAVPNTDNYNSDITYTAGTLTVSTRPSGGGGDDSGSSGGGSDSGSGGSSTGGSSSGGTVTPPPTAITPTNPNPPTTGEINAPATVDNNGNASITVTDQTVADAIKQAQDEAKKNGTEKNGVAVELNVDTGKKAPNSISANLPKTVQDSLVEGKVSEFKIVSETANLTFDNKALQEIQKQAGGDATINASKADVSKLSKEARDEIGNRPVFNLSITGKDGKTISDFGGGSATVSIPYTLQPNENPNNLQAYFVDAQGKLHEVACTYDPVTKCMVFVTNHFSTYGIGYKVNVPKFNDIEKNWAKNDIEFVTARGWLAGTSANTFSPDSSVTTRDFATALTKLSGKDVSTIVENSNKDAAISRQEIAVIMQKFAKLTNYNLPKLREKINFSDVTSEAVKSMQMAGVIMGKDGNRFDPTGTATRAEVSAVLRRYTELVIDKTTAQGLDVNDSGKIVYYENGKLFTGVKTIDGTTYHFGDDGICTKMDAIISDTKKYIVHKVVRGDTLWNIAMKNKCTVAEIVGLNGIKNPNNVPIGTELKIPQK